LIELLQKQKYPVILLFASALFLLLGTFEVVSIQALRVRSLPTPNYLSLGLGFLFLCLSTASFALDEVTLGWLKFRRIRRLGTGFSTTMTNTEVCVAFGRLEQVAEGAPESMVVLPATEFFDPECVRDRKSALGAYVHRHFTNQEAQIEAFIAKELASKPTQRIEQSSGVFEKSFGVGTRVFAKRLLESKQPLLFIAITTKRANEGVRAELSDTFKAVQQIQNVAADNRIDSVLLPVLGAGHGHLRPEAALFGLLLAICGSLNSPRAHHIKRYTVVVFQPDGNSKPSIRKAVCKRLLRIAVGMYSDD
jgi:hypothetical protein